MGSKGTLLHTMRVGGRNSSAPLAFDNSGRHIVVGSKPGMKVFGAAHSDETITLRFRPVQEKLVAAAAAKSDPSADGGAALKQAIARLVPGDPLQQNRLLQKYLARDSGDRKSRPRSGR